MDSDKAQLAFCHTHTPGKNVEAGLKSQKIEVHIELILINRKYFSSYK